MAGKQADTHTTANQSPSEQDPALLPGSPSSRYAKWRALSLIGVYVLMIVHIMHFKATGKTMAPLELSEIMKALELGVVSPGVIFIGIMIFGSAIFGRFFCSWACHMLAVQDLANWVYGKLRIRPLFVRSRVLLLVPFLTAGYMFFWPQIKRIWEGRSLPEASARLVTTNFWRDLPGPLIMALTFLTCGFAIVYFFGGRGFCRYGCPYGVLFGLFARLAPGRIRVREGCQQCGTCTDACTSGVRVHEQLRAHGMVVDPNCLKDLDCISVCPHEAISYRFGRPSIARPRLANLPKQPYDFSWSEEIAMVVLFALSLLVWRGLYGRLPFLLSIALAAITAYVTISTTRLLFASHVSVNRYVLKDHGQFTRNGFVFAVLASLFLLLTVHSGFVHYHSWRGQELWVATKGVPRTARDARADLADRAIAHLALADRYGLTSTMAQDMTLGALYMLRDDPGMAEAYYRRTVDHTPTNADARIGLAGALIALGRRAEAAAQLDAALRIYSPHDTQATYMKQRYAAAHVLAANLLVEEQRLQEAAKHYALAVKLDDRHAGAHLGLGALASLRGQLDEAERHYRRSIDADPQAAEAHANLGDVLTAQGQPELALEQYEQALQIDNRLSDVHHKAGYLATELGDYEAGAALLRTALRHEPDRADLLCQLGIALMGVPDPIGAESAFQQALTRDNTLAEAHFHLGKLYLARGDKDAARQAFAQAVRLDRTRYAPRVQDAMKKGVRSHGM